MFIIQQRIYIILALLAISNIKAPPIKQSTSDSDYFELERLNSEEESDESSSYIDRLIEQKHCSHFYNKTDDQNNVCGQDNNKNGLCNSTAICRDQTRNTLLYFHFPDNNNVEKTPVADGPEFQCIPTCLSGIISNGICFDNEEQQERINKICIDDTIDREEPLKTASLSSTILIVASVIIIVIVSCCIFCIKGHLNKSNTSLLATKSVLFSMKVKKKEKNRSFAIILKGYPRVFITAEEYDEIETKIFEEAGEFGDHIKITRNEMCYVKVDTYSQDACDWILQLKCSGIINNNFNIIPIEQVEKILVCLKYSGFPLQADKVPTYIMHNNREFEGCMITIDEDYCKDGVQNIVLKIDPKALMVFEEKQFKVKVRDHYYQFERFYKHDIHSISRLSIKEMDNPLITYMSQAE